jgi:hypothetical protein
LGSVSNVASDNAFQGDGRSGKSRRGVAGACPLSPNFITPGKVVLVPRLHHARPDTGPGALCLGVSAGREIGLTNIPARCRKRAQRDFAFNMQVYEANIQYSLVRVGNDDPSPSAPDLAVTRQLREAAKTMDIHLLDHVIIGTKEDDPTGQGFHSFRQAGLI